MKKKMINALNWLDNVAPPFIYTACAVYVVYKGDIKLAGAYAFLIGLFFINKKLKKS